MIKEVKSAKSLLDSVKFGIQKLLYIAMYNPKKFFGFAGIGFVIFLSFIALIYYKKSTNQDRLISEIKIMQDVMQSGKSIDVEKIEKLKIKNPNILGSLLVFNLINHASSVDIDEIERTQSIAKNLKADLLTLSNIQYACAIAFLQILKINDDGKNQEKIFNQIKSIRTQIATWYAKNNKKDFDFFDVLQSQLDANILSNLRLFNSKQQKEFSDLITQSGYIKNKTVTNDKKYVNQVISLHK